MIRPRCGLKRFDKGKKFAPRFIGPFEVLELVGELSYRPALPPELSCIHDVFHISALNQIFHMFWIGKNLSIRKYLAYEEKPVRIVDRKEQVRRSRNGTLNYCR